MSKLVKYDAPELAQLDPSKALMIKQTFEPMVQMLEAIETDYNKVIEKSVIAIDNQVIAEARTLRLAIAKIRIGAEKVRKEQKEEYLRAGKAIDGVSNILKYAIVDKEEKLEAIENHFQRMEAERLQKIVEERRQLLSQVVDPLGYDLANMTDEVFTIFLNGKKAEKLAFEEAEKKAKADAEAKALADLKERELLRVENERLALEQKKLNEEKAKAEADSKAKLAEMAKANAEAMAKANAEKAKLEAEIKAKADAEAKAKADVEAREADKAHKQKINCQAKNDLIAIGLSDELARDVIKAIVQNKISNITIRY